MNLSVLSSSSSGNCYLLETDSEILIIECGVSYKEILKGLNFNLSKVSAVLLSHQHADHSKSAKDITNAGIDLYALRETTDAIALDNHRTINVEPLKQFAVGDFKVMGFPIEHDVPGLGYLIKYKPTGERLLFLTDSYYSKYKFKGLNYVLIECNYILDTLDENIAAGRISEAMKPRLLRSHFSLDNVINFLKANDLSQCREIVLLHLSDSNSDAERMVREIHEAVGIKPVVADAGLELDLELYPY